MTRETYSTTTRAAAHVQRTIARTNGTVRLEVRRDGYLLAAHALRGDDLAHLEVAHAIATCGRPAFARVAVLTRPRHVELEIIASTGRVLVARFERGALVHAYDLEADELEPLERALADAREAT
jgi:hypothetical protein